METLRLRGIDIHGKKHSGSDRALSFMGLFIIKSVFTITKFTLPEMQK